MIFSSIRELLCGEQELLDGNWRNSSFDALPHATKCAQHLDFAYIPAIFLLLFAPVTLYDLHKSKNAKLRPCSPITLRILICVVLVIDLTLSSFYNLYNWHSTGDAGARMLFFGDLAQYIGLCIALTLMIACRNRGIVTSGVLFIYWFLMVVCGFPEFRYEIVQFSKQEEDFNAVIYTLYLIYYPLLCLELILSCFADMPSQQIFGKNICPEHQSSFLSQLTFQWFTAMATKGNRQPLTREDLWELNDHDKGDHLIPEFDVNFHKELKDAREKSELTGKPQKPSIVRALAKTYKWTLITGAFYKFLFDMLQFVAPELLKQLISFIQDDTQPQWIGVAIALIMFLAALVQSMILHQYFHLMFRLGMNIRAVLTSAVYTKTMTLSNNARKTRTTGEIVNLMMVDLQRFQDLTNFVMLFWSSPLQVILSIVFLYRLLGWVVFVGLILLVLLIPFNWAISIQIRKSQSAQMKLKDERLKMMSEILNGIKVLKLYAWEKSMEKMVLDIRQKEIDLLKKLAFLNAATTLSWACAPFLVAVITFGIYVSVDPEHNILTPQVTFVALALFNIMRFPLAIFALIYSQAIQWRDSNQRLKSFFAEEEMDLKAIERKHSSTTAIKLENALFGWEKAQTESIRIPELSIKRGELIAIVGRVGSGKSSLLQAILGEMNKIDGSVNISGSIAYVAQLPWIQNLSLRDNITFSKDMERGFYNKVIEACALMPDLDALPAGDYTEIGEKGINLSGGQKSRVALARAVYARSDIVLLDDPLSAVDAHVGKHIFENVLSSNGILSHTTRVLVTHGLNYLAHCDRIVVMKEGTISEMGTYQELLSRQGAFSELIEEYLVEQSKSRGRSVSFSDGGDVKEMLNEIEKVNPRTRARIESHMSVDESNREKSEPPPSPSPTPTNGAVTTGSPSVTKKASISIKNDEKVALLGDGKEKETKANNPNGKIMAKENIQTGKVKWTIYFAYLKAIGVPITILFVSVYIFSSILGVGSNLWLARWSDDAKHIVETSEDPGQETRQRLLIYAILGVGQAFFVCSASIIMALGMVRASRLLHEGILFNTLRSPMNFFDTTPLGQIINRFGKDIEAIDTTLPNTIRSMVLTVINVVATIVVIAIATPLVVLVYVALAVGYYVILKFYVSTSRQLKRLESASRSPIYSHFLESVQGAASIRAYGVSERFVLESQKRVDENLATYYPSIVANRWLAVRLELVGNLIVLFAALFAAIYRDSPGLTAGLVGLSVSYALNITQTLNWAVRMTSELETNIVAVERIKEYSELPMEGEHSQQCPPQEWPTEGRIDIKNFSIRYRQGLDLVLKNITAHINPQEKVGIVGRTGAGKSSLTLALFRIVEADGGEIVIDGENLSHLQLQELRAKLTIVPQDPVLFSGSLRLNLDPFHAFADDQIWEALRDSHLDTFVMSLPDKLQHSVSEGGQNLSVGQRQLLCLARAILRRTKILILDEAAAAVDVETDALLQKTIREQFKHCTVLTIAHRLNTVMDCDRLLVLDKGEVVEFDAPKALLANHKGYFYSMAKDAGIA